MSDPEILAPTARVLLERLGELQGAVGAMYKERRMIEQSAPVGFDVNQLRRKAEAALAAGMPFMSVPPADMLALLDALHLLRERRRIGGTDRGRTSD